MFVNVIIPTYNRKELLRRTLASLAQQTFPADRFEVIVVDDGSSDGTEALARNTFPFSLRYLRKTNQGATAARNRGAKHSKGEYLVFVDDDIVLEPITLAALVNELSLCQRTIILGTLRLPAQLKAKSPFASIGQHDVAGQHDGGYVPFQECQTGLLAIKRADFVSLGMFQDPAGGWPNWDDVDFGYRAHPQGFRFIRCKDAVGEHWDYALTSLRIACQRWWRASKSAVRLFHKYPEIQPHLPMFRDKTPIAWGQDPPRLVARKLARHGASSRPALWGLEQLVHVLEQRYPSPALLRPLYRWVIGGYIFRGYREGLREHGPVEGSGHVLPASE